MIDYYKIGRLEKISSIKMNNASVTELLLDETYIDEEFDLLVDALRQNITITNISVINCELTSNSIIRIITALEHHPVISEITVLQSKDSDTWVEAIAASLKNSKTFIELHLTFNEITDNGALALAKFIRANASLKVLSLMNNKISEKGFTAMVEALQTNATLTSLNILNNKLSKQDELELSSAIDKLLKRNKALAKMDNPIEKANLLGDITGDRKVPSLYELGLFAVKHCYSAAEINTLHDKIADDIYKDIIQPPPEL